MPSLLRHCYSINSVISILKNVKPLQEVKNLQTEHLYIIKVVRIVLKLGN